MEKGKYHHSKEIRRRIALSKLKEKNPNWEKFGNKNPNWKGGEWKRNDRYVLVYLPTHPYCNNKGYIMKHRLVMEGYLGRVLLPSEIVHHINGNESDNRVENLMLFENKNKHMLFHKKFNKENGLIPKWKQKELK